MKATIGAMVWTFSVLLILGGIAMPQGVAIIIGMITMFSFGAGYFVSLMMSAHERRRESENDY